MRWIATVALLTGLNALATPVAASPGDDVVAIPPGGISEASLLRVDLNATSPNVNTTPRRLVSDGVGVTNLQDFKVIGETNILADDGPVGTAIINSEFHTAYSYNFQGLGHTSVAVAGFTQAGRIERLLTASTTGGRVSIIDRSLDAVMWNYSVTEPTSRPSYRRVIALPDQRVALALDWSGTAAPVSMIDVVSLAADGSGIRIASRRYAGAPDNLIVQPAIDGLQDLFALDNNSFLFATRHRIGQVDTAGNLAWVLDASSREAIDGVFSAIIGLESGDAVVATRTQGKWLEPGINHRVHWLDGNDRSVLASSGPLDFAPIALDLAGGHGGSGTLGFAPDESFVPVQKIGDDSVSASLRLTPNPVVTGTTGRVTASLVNVGDNPLILRDFQVAASLGTCGSESESPENSWLLLPPRDVVMQAGVARELSGTFDPDSQTPETEWCAEISARTEEGEATRLGPATDFRITTPGSDAGRFPKQDLGFGNGGPYQAPRDLPSGCGCRSASPPEVGPMILLVFVGLLVRRSG